MSTAPGSGHPLTLAERRRLQPPWSARTALDLAIRTLPPEHRERYAREFYAELYGLSRREQTRMAFGMLLHIQHLVWALGDPSPDLDRRVAKHKDWRCVLFIHHDVRRHNHEEALVRYYFECTRCRRIHEIPPPQIAALGGW